MPLGWAATGPFLRRSGAAPEHPGCGTVVMDGTGVVEGRTSTYSDGTRVGWSKVKDRSWYEREAWRFDRR